MSHQFLGSRSTKTHRLTILGCVIGTTLFLSCKTPTLRPISRVEPLAECQIRENIIYRNGYFGSSARIQISETIIDQKCTANRAFILTTDTLYTVPFDNPFRTEINLLEEPTTISDISQIRERLVCWIARTDAAYFITRDSELHMISISGGANRQFRLRADLNEAQISLCRENALCINNAVDRGRRGTIVLELENETIQSYAFYPQ